MKSAASSGKSDANRAGFSDGFSDDRVRRYCGDPFAISSRH